MPRAPLLPLGITALLSALLRQALLLGPDLAAPQPDAARLLCCAGLLLLTASLCAGAARLRFPLALLCAGVAPWCHALPPAPNIVESREVTAVFRLLEPPRCPAHCAAAARGPDGRVLLRFPPPSDPTALSSGTLLLARVKLRPLPGITVPGRGLPDDARRARFAGATELALVRDSDRVVRLPDRAHGATTETPLLARARSRLRTLVRRHAPAEHAGLYAALLLGDKSGLPEEQRALFARTGTAHLLAVSGLHVGLVAVVCAGLFAVPLRRLRSPHCARDPVRRSWVAGLIAGLLYTLIAGAPLSARRALLFLGMGLVARSTDRPFPLWNVIGLAALAASLLDPVAAASVSFLLSISAVAGIAAVLPPMEPTGRPTWSRRLRGSVRVSIGASIGTAPLLAWIFGALPIASVPANLIAAPLLGTLTLPLLLLCSLLALSIPDAAGLLLSIPAPFVDFALSGLSLLDGVPALAPLSLRPPPTRLLCWTAALIAAGIALPLPAVTGRLRRIEARWIAAACIPVLLLAPLLAERLHPALRDAPPDNSLALTLIDVGHGAAAVLHLPDGRVFLVDGGSEWAGASRVLPALERMGVRRLNGVIVSHGDADHAAGLIAVLERKRVDRLYVPCAPGAPDAPDRTDSLAPLIDRAIAQGVPVVPLHSAAPGPHPSIAVLGPSPADPDGDENHRSVVLRVTAGARSFLLTGDIDAERETALLHGGANLQSDLLLAPHHGSRGSSTPAFLESTNPVLVLAATGRKGRTTWPHPRTVATVRATGAELLHTRRDGTIQVVTNGAELRVRVYAESRWSRFRSID